MKIQILFLAAIAAFGQATFVFKDGYPLGCTDISPADPAAGGSYNVGNRASCVIPGLKPPGDFAPPPVGGSYVDPTFGHTVTVSSSFGYYQTYSTPSPLSATGKYLAVVGKDTDGTVGGTTAIVAAKTGAWVRKVAGASQDWGFRWHPTNDDIYFTINGKVIYRRNATTTESTKVFEDTAGIVTGGTGDISADLWFAYATSRDVAVGKLCTAPLDGSGKKACIPLAGMIGAGSNFDFALVSKGRDSITGKRYVMLEQGGRVFEVDETAGVLVDRGNSGADWNHSDTMQGPDGRQYVFAMTGWPGQPWPGVPGGDAATFWLLADPTVKYKAFQVSWGSPVVAGPNATHFNCAKTKPSCALGFSPNSVPPTANAPGEREPWGYEAIKLTMTATGAFEVQRLAKTRTVRRNATVNGTPLSQDYDSMPMCGLSGDAMVVACKTNWGIVPYAGHERPTSPGVRQVITIDASGGGPVPPPNPCPPCPVCPVCPPPACDCEANAKTIEAQKVKILQLEKKISDAIKVLQ